MTRVSLHATAEAEQLYRSQGFAERSIPLVAGPVPVAYRMSAARRPRQSAGSSAMRAVPTRRKPSRA